MLFNSLPYLIFFPVVFFGYFAIPKRFRYLWLLMASYFFYMCWNASYALLMLTSTLITYASGIFIEKCTAKGSTAGRKVCVAVSFSLNLAILVFFKYGNFIVDNINAVFGAQARHFDVLLPVGISFYTFQALGYTMDVYRGLPAEKNVAYYALFVSFFPQLVAGPIERTATLLPQLKNPGDFNPDKARRGLPLIAWGLFLKMVLADNLARIVNPIFESYAAYAGIDLVVAVSLFAFQIYCDFAGYSLIARGSAAVFGIDLMQNFRSPYLATSVSDFWRRWHISLTTWFTDYLYIPLGGNRKGKARKYVNTMIVFLVSGLWHGASWTFVVWGAMNGAMIVLSDLTVGIRAQAVKRLRIDPASFGHTLFRRVLTFALIGVTWFFFRAPSFEIAVDMLRAIFTDLQLPRLLSASIFTLGIHAQTVTLVLLSIAALMFVDAMQNKGVSPSGWLLRQGAALRWLIYIGFVFVIIVYGVYGKTYAQTQFLYFQF